MNFANKIYKKFAGAVLLCALCLVGAVSQSCKEDIDQSNRYTFTGETVIDYLENRSDSFGLFVKVLDKATVGKGGSIKHLLSTYGRYTCFAPTDHAILAYVEEQYEKWYNDSIAAFVDKTMPEADFKDTGVHSPYFEDLTKEKCTEIAKNHIIEGAIFHTYNFPEGALGRASMNDRYITCTFVPDKETGATKVKLNDESLCIVQDCDVENGVVHALDKVLNPSNSFTSDLLKKYEEYFSMFAELISATGLDQVLSVTSYDMEATGIKYGEPKKREFAATTSWSGYAKTPDTHYIKYTILAVPDCILDSVYGIKSIDDPTKGKTLLEYAEEWYPNSNYVKGETPMTSPDHPLYRLMAYHIVDRALKYNGGFVQDGIDFADFGSSFNSEIKNGAEHGFDRYEYYETLLDNGKMIKCTKPFTSSANPDERGDLLKEIVINYGQQNGAKCVNPAMSNHINVRVLQPKDFKKLVKVADAYKFDQEAVNGWLHPVDRMLIYNHDEMKGNVFDERIRMNFMSFFPELTNNNIRWAYGEESGQWQYYYIPDGYCKRIQFYAAGSSMYYLYSHDGSTGGWSDYQGDEIITSGAYDFAYRLPHVPAGTYELRLGTCLYTLRGIAQAYLDGKVTGLPLDLRFEKTDAGQNEEYYSPLVAERFAWKDDSSFDSEEEIRADDRARRARGYMKGPASQFVNNGQNTLRQAYAAARIIIGTFKLDDNSDHWIRFKNTRDVEWSEFMHNYMELVPKSVLADPSKPEDIY